MNNMVLEGSTTFADYGATTSRIKATIGVTAETYYVTTNGGNLEIHAITSSTA